MRKLERVSASINCIFQYFCAYGPDSAHTKIRAKHANWAGKGTDPLRPGSALVYSTHMTRTNIDIDDEACAEVMRRFRLATKREAVNFALRRLAAESLGIDEARRLRGSGWEGDLAELRLDPGG